MLSLVGGQVRAALGPIQYALAPGGSESALHVLQAAIDLHPDWVVISSDITNAFHSSALSNFIGSF